MKREDKQVPEHIEQAEGILEDRKVKLPFVAPKLVVHGSITELTAFTGSGSV